VLLAAALAWTWRRTRLALVWAASVPVALVVHGDHTPTDVAAGALVAVGLLGLLATFRSASDRL
jgi:membrane-associated phospholipid phosphatase